MSGLDTQHRRIRTRKQRRSRAAKEAKFRLWRWVKENKAEFRKALRKARKGNLQSAASLLHF